MHKLDNLNISNDLDVDGTSKLDDVSFREKTMNVAREQTKSLQHLASSFQSQKESLQGFTQAVNKQFEKLQDTHTDIYKQETDFLANGITEMQQVLYSMRNMLDVLVKVTQEMSRRR